MNQAQLRRIVTIVVIYFCATCILSSLTAIRYTITKNTTFYSWEAMIINLKNKEEGQKLSVIQTATRKNEKDRNINFWEMNPNNTAKDDTKATPGA